MIDRESRLREDICEVGKRLWKRELVAAHDGNISSRLSDDLIICTPTGVSKGFMASRDLILVDNAGTTHEAGRPSSELKMHLEIYRHRPDVCAIVHAHPPHATAFAVAGINVPSGVMPEIDMLLGSIALIPYCTPGTVQFAEAFRPYLQGSNVFLISNHGATTVGATLEEAWFRMESLDACCRTLLSARQLGEWRPF